MSKTRVVSKRVPKITEEKLEREDALGQCWQDNGEIQIDPRQNSKEYLDTLIHELLHCFFPDASEKDVEKIGNKMSNAVWKKGFRRIHK